MAGRLHGRGPGRFLVLVAGIVAAGLLAIAAFNAVIDPYGIIGTPPIAGVSEHKIAAAERPRLSKPYRIEQMQPATILLGSSQVNIGFDASDEAWPAELRPVYNLGIDGASLAVQLRFLRHALVHARPRLVVVGLSYADMLLTPRVAVTQGPGDMFAFGSRMRVDAEGRPNASYWMGRLKDLSFATLSMQSLRDSFKTIVDQVAPPREQTANGSDTRAQFLPWIERDGIQAVIRGSLQTRANEILTHRLRPGSSLAALEPLIRAAQESGADVMLVVPPVYVAGLIQRNRAGLDGEADQWLREIVALAGRLDRPPGRPGRVTVWDFEDAAGVRQQALPTTGSRTPLTWFWEAVHFRPEFGTLIIRRITGQPVQDPAGVVVTEANVEAFLARQHADLVDWEAAHPEAANGINGLIAESYEQSCKRRPSLCADPPSLPQLPAGAVD